MYENMNGNINGNMNGNINGNMNGNMNGNNGDEDLRDLNDYRKNLFDDPDKFNRNGDRLTDDENKSIDSKKKKKSKSKKKKSKSKSKKRKANAGTRPPFVNYGNKNVTPAAGGFLYGNYLHSHNVNPHRCPNSPEYKESYKTAINHAK